MLTYKKQNLTSFFKQMQSKTERNSVTADTIQENVKIKGTKDEKVNIDQYETKPLKNETRVF